jgi:osmotically-inducible protein OsmY
MRSDHQLQKAVLEQLDFEPSIDSSHIGVAAREGVVTLTGHVPSIGEKRAAERAVGHVRGVKAVIDCLTVELPGHRQTPDETLAERAYARLASNSSVPADRIHLSVDDGVLTLHGDVDWHYQRQAAEADLHQLDCVLEIRNEIAIKPPVKVAVIREKIHDALARIGPIDADRIEVKADGGHVILSGTVTSWHQKGMAESAAWSVPGVTSVADEIVVV